MFSRLCDRSRTGVPPVMLCQPGNQDVADSASERDPKDPPGLGGNAFLRKRAVGGERVPVQVSFGFECTRPSEWNEAGEHPDRVRAAAESEHPDAVVLFRIVFVSPIVVAEKLIQIDHVALDADPERQAEHAQKADGRISDAVAEDRDLAAVAQIERLIEAPYVGLERFRCAVSGTIGKSDQISRCPCHGSPPLR